jgi:DNA-binding MarR family transcriptional regulator
MLPLLAAGALSVVCQMFRRWNSRTVEADWGMTGPRVTALVMLVQARSLTMGEIAGTLEVTPRAVRRLVDGLEADGYVIRARDPKDKRVVHVTCTQQALRLAEERMPALMERMAALFADFPADRLRSYVQIINAVGERIRPDLEQGASAPPELTAEIRDQL